MQIQPYLFFNGHCEEALAFYRRTFAAEITVMMRYKDNPEPQPPDMLPPGSENKVMHASLRIGDSTILASDGRCGGKAQFQGFSLTVYVNDAVEAERVFAALSEKGQVQMPLGKTFFSPHFGMVTDRFGVGWIVIVPAPTA